MPPSVIAGCCYQLRSNVSVMMLVKAGDGLLKDIFLCKKSGKIES